ncbi:MAG: FAD-dependent oxidoreductase [Xanthobacteraceae bacterium]
MNAHGERTVSLWMDAEVAPDAPKLTQNERADAVVLGSGIAGLSTAYELSEKGLSVVVIDRGAIGGGMTARTSAHLTCAPDDTFAAVRDMRGADGARIFFESHAAAIDRIEAIQEGERIDCNFRRLNGYLFPGPKMEPGLFAGELDAGGEAGMQIKRHKGLPFACHSDVGCLLYPRQAAFHPLRYLRGLVNVIKARGGRLYADTAAMSVEERDDAVEVKTERGETISAAKAVVATNSPVNDKYTLHTKEAPYRSYVMAFTIPKDSIEDALYWDTLDPYHYVRLHTGPGSVDYLIVGGADHKTGEADDAGPRFDAIEAWIRAKLPNLGKETHRWSGQVLESIDYAAFSGRNPGNENVFVHTADSGQGLTHGVAGSLLISTLILGGKSEWAAFYEPSRKILNAAKNFVTENLTAVKNFAEYVAPGELKSVDELKPGQGAIVREGMSKVAAYRDDNGRLHRLSAKCTHVGCHVHWNSLERCWDCPCHGSHFGTDGAVLNGPAISPLEEL